MPEDVTAITLNVDLPWPRNFQSDEDIEDVRTAMLAAGLHALGEVVSRRRRPTGANIVNRQTDR